MSCHATTNLNIKVHVQDGRPRFSPVEMVIADFSHLSTLNSVYTTLICGISDARFVGTALVTILVIASFQSVYLRKVEIKLRGCEKEKVLGCGADFWARECFLTVFLGVSEKAIV